MPSIRHFTIIFDKPQPVFMPGEPITGRAILALNEPLSVKGVLLEFRGEARVGWHESETYPHRDHNGKDEMRTRTVYYRAARDYVNANVQVYGAGQLVPMGNLADTINGGADYVWPFNFQLPAGIPSSFEGRHGSIRYFIKSVVQKSAMLSINHRKKTYFNVVGYEDCNLPQYRIPLTFEDQKHTCCWCCASDPIRIEVRIDRQAYTPLDSIAIFGSFANGSTREIEPRAILMQTVTYRAHRGYASDYDGYFGFGWSHTRVEKHTICEVRGKKIQSRGSDTWSPLLMQIPIVAPTINTCDIMMVQYHIKISLHVPMGKNMEGLFPITIGTIPYRGPPAVGFGAGLLPSGAPQQFDSTANIMGSSMTNVPSFVPPADYNTNGKANEAASSVRPNPTAPPPIETPTGPSAPPAYWDLFPKPPEPETEET